MNNLNTCDNCEITIKNSNTIFYKDFYNSFYNVFKKTKINNHDLCRYIFSFLTYNNGHNVTHQLKKRLPMPNESDSEYDSDFDQDYYWFETKLFCTCCFQTGIILSLKNQQRLPYLRRDIYYFLQETDIETSIIKYRKKYYQFFLNYRLPKQYNITYYRNELPLKENNQYTITNK